MKDLSIERVVFGRFGEIEFGTDVIIEVVLGDASQKVTFIGSRPVFHGPVQVLDRLGVITVLEFQLSELDVIPELVFWILGMAPAWQNQYTGKEEKE
jgi:hypothetical protein